MFARAGLRERPRLATIKIGYYQKSATIKILVQAFAAAAVCLCTTAP
jgi:hypothetical protein